VDVCSQYQLTKNGNYQRKKRRRGKKIISLLWLIALSFFRIHLQLHLQILILCRYTLDRTAESVGAHFRNRFSAQIRFDRVT
jgi:hypothetical protein